MVSIAKKDYFVSDWINGVRIITAGTLVEAIKVCLGHENILPYQDRDSCDAFGIEVSDDVHNIVTSKEDSIGQTEGLAGVNGVKFYKKA